MNAASDPNVTAAWIGIGIVATILAILGIGLLWWHGQIGEEQRLTATEQDVRGAKLTEFEKKLDRRHRKLYQDREQLDRDRAEWHELTRTARAERVAEGLVSQIQEIAAMTEVVDGPRLHIVDDAERAMPDTHAWDVS